MALPPELMSRRRRSRVQKVVSMLTVKAIKRDLAPYFARQGETLLAYFFGSVGQGHANKLSDVDITLLASSRWRT